MSEDEPRLTLAFPTLVKDGAEPKEDNTLVQTRPWSMGRLASDDSVEIQISDENFDLPEAPQAGKPDQMAHTMPAVGPPPSVTQPRVSPASKPTPSRVEASPSGSSPSGSFGSSPSGSFGSSPSGSMPSSPSASLSSSPSAPAARASRTSWSARAARHDDSFLGKQPSTEKDDALDDRKIIGGKYEAEARIGEGGMGRVYRVRHVELGKTFALKIMRSVMADNEKLRQGFFREARLASSLSHPQIVSIVDFGQDPALGVFMVMELLEGEPLKKILKERGRFSVRAACDVMLQIADAVRYVHSKGIIHCDLKAENVLLASERSETGRRAYRVKLLDFGLARPHTGGDRSMTLSGTPAYIAPERIRGARPAPSMDIYALAILFYELLTGGPPFSGSLETVLYHHVNDPPPSPSEAVTKAGGDPLDERVEALILKALAKDPAERQQSVGAFMYELRTAMEMLGYTTRRRSRSPKPSRSSSSSSRSDLSFNFVEGLFAECPLPLAVLSSEGQILVGNKAFSVFVCGDKVDLRGTSLSDTSLLRACPTLLKDIRSVLAEGKTVQVGLSTPGKNGLPTQLLLWLTPGPPDTQHVYCAIHLVGRM
jgi:serine/threonine-protein kinase